MKKLITVLLFTVMGTFAFSQTKKAADIKSVCKELGINPDYNKRYEDIILPLCDANKYLFDKTTNPYVSGENANDIIDTKNGRKNICYWYIGTSQQNEILIRNLYKNRELIKKGKLTAANAKKWVVVK